MRPLTGSRLLSSALLCALGLSAGCGDDQAYPLAPQLPEEPLVARAVEWNSGGEAVGEVAALTEHGDELVVLSDRGALFFSGGALRELDPSVTTWRQAARVPAVGAEGEWPVGVDGGGRLRWLRGRDSLDDVTDRYGLPGAIRDLAALGRGRVGFALESTLLCTDGPSARRYEVRAAGLRGGGGRAALVGEGVVRVFDPAEGSGKSYALPGVVAAVLDPAGRLVAATATALYQEGEGGALLRVHEEPAGAAAIAGLATAGTAVWVAIGDQLAILRGGRLLRGPEGLGAGATRLLGSPTGDLWLVGPGRLSRVAEADGGDPDQALWKRSVLPLFTRSCSQCHQAGALAADLSFYEAWTSRRALIEQRVIDGKPTPMPPAGAAPLTTEELADLQGWLAAGK